MATHTARAPGGSGGDPPPGTVFNEKVKAPKDLGKYRNFCATWFDDPDIDKVYNAVSQKGKRQVRYVVIGIEICPTTERKHWQAYVQLLGSSTKRAIKRLFRRVTGKDAHWEPQWAEECQDPAAYCMKDGKYEERGTMKQQGTNTRVADVKAMIDDEELTVEEVRDLVPYQVWCQYGRVFKEDIARQRCARRKKKTEVVIRWGVSDGGKSHAALKLEGGEIVSYENGFFSHVCDHMVFDDFQGNEFSQGMFRRILDKYPLKVNVKGSFVEFNPKKITITSNRDPRSWELWCPEIERRVTKIVHYPEVYPSKKRKLEETEVRYDKDSNPIERPIKKDHCVFEGSVLPFKGASAPFVGQSFFAVP